MCDLFYLYNTFQKFTNHIGNLQRYFKAQLPLPLASSMLKEPHVSQQ